MASFQSGFLHLGQKTHRLCGAQKVTGFFLECALSARYSLMLARDPFRFPSLSRTLSSRRLAGHPIRMEVWWYSRKEPCISHPLFTVAVMVRGFGILGYVSSPRARSRRGRNPIQALLYTIGPRLCVWITVVSLRLPEKIFWHEGSGVRRGIGALSLH